MEGKINNLNLKETELRLGLPGTTDNEKQETETINSGLRINNNNNNKRNFPNTNLEINGSTSNQDSAPPPKTQVVGWPPIRSFRKNSLQAVKKELSESENGGSGIYVKVSMDGAPYLRKIDLSVYKGYPQLLNALEDMFKFTIGQYSEREAYKGSDFLPTYEDKDGDWMLAGDVPWDMFISSCKRLRIMKGSEAGGLAFGGV